MPPKCSWTQQEPPSTTWLLLQGPAARPRFSRPTDSFQSATHAPAPERPAPAGGLRGWDFGLTAGAFFSQERAPACGQPALRPPPSPAGHPRALGLPAKDPSPGSPRRLPAGPPSPPSLKSRARWRLGRLSGSPSSQAQRPRRAPDGRGGEDCALRPAAPSMAAGPAVGAVARKRRLEGPGDRKGRGSGPRCWGRCRETEPGEPWGPEGAGRRDRLSGPSSPCPGADFRWGRDHTRVREKS